MSLGAPLYNQELVDALNRARASGAIMFAAAGNQLPFSANPADYSSVIGVMGSNVDNEFWENSSFGSNMELIAPAENIFRAASNDKGEHGVKISEGTSYSAAISSGVAASWLAHHGESEIFRTLDKANSIGFSEKKVDLTDLYRYVIEKSKNGKQSTMTCNSLSFTAKAACKFTGADKNAVNLNAYDILSVKLPSANELKTWKERYDKHISSRYKDIQINENKMWKGEVLLTDKIWNKITKTLIIAYEEGKEMYHRTLKDLRHEYKSNNFILELLKKMTSKEKKSRIEESCNLYMSEIKLQQKIKTSNHKNRHSRRESKFK